MISAISSYNLPKQNFANRNNVAFTGKKKILQKAGKVSLIAVTEGLKFSPLFTKNPDLVIITKLLGDSFEGMIRSTVNTSLLLKGKNNKGMEVAIGNKFNLITQFSKFFIEKSSSYKSLPKETKEIYNKIF